MVRTDGMDEYPAEGAREKVGEVYRSDSRRGFATLVRVLGDLDLAEDALHNAFAAAMKQ
jgi:RNA polymerase sigma-70 factor (ECF subfamily)